MKRKYIVPGIMAAGVIAVGFAIAEHRGGGTELELKVDKSPPERSGPMGGYSAVVEKVSPSVVSIFTTREAVRLRERMPDMGRFFDRHPFRDFFGERFGPDPRWSRPRGPRMPKQQGLGSGVILTEGGLILTNNHVVEHADEIKVQLASGVEHDAGIVATDPSSDLAVIRIEAGGLPAATIGDSGVLKPGDLVFAIGSPFGLNHTVTSGIVSAVGRDNLNITGYDDFIQTDASINPGNSGGALVDNKGRVVGINTAIMSRSGGNIGIGFAIPINTAVRIAEELIAHGEITRGYLGVSLAPLDAEVAEALEVDAQGVVVNEVRPDTPAEKAGFKAGDVIVSVGGENVEDIGDVRRLVSREKPGTKLEFAVRRGGKSLTLNATIGEMPDDLLAATGSGDSP